VSSQTAPNPGSVPAPGSWLWPGLGLTGILSLALALRCWNLGAGGFITPYYMAGVRSMSVSWHNFFFNAFDPTGFVSLDKPPLAFWIQTGSVALLGFSPFGVLLPQVLEGAASILLLSHLVGRVFGPAAGLLAALFLALMPIAVAVDRSNNTDTCLVLILLVAAWAVSRAVETGRARFLLLSASLVGIGFNTKMLVAFGVVPVFIALYIAGAQIPMRRSSCCRGARTGGGVVVLGGNLRSDAAPAPPVCRQLPRQLDARTCRRPQRHPALCQASR
jgi:4-amino-4-deoxy-L-arabinose transferase-like glycosyltransferase